ncbi:uncharacterized protein BO80DRAFT_442159 [Aspergillus ibericus CBS 121593]|uniref:Rhodopsin domain-containing protein n=1 Tax=Aspergillus ibericus CBS 121593 TaxID=1448316 RepID=A0A395H8C2_9EURO|nr:hypothetical protein BO80DRAFT_442159 [Aspergillus ibericus CBS 121593]RAL04157.1 hypothetical protein BO80DRAFT_442159 [Aspergillus ibericus CBS 121593]
MTYVNQGSVLGVGVLFTLLGTLAIAARFYVQGRSRRLGADDWIALAAWVLVTADAAIMIAGATTRTVGSHSPEGIATEILYYDGWDQVLLERFEFPFDLFQIVALATLKLSVLFFYRRIFVGRIFNIASWVLTGVVIVWAATFVIAILSACGTRIMANFGTLGDLKTECVDTFSILIALAASDVTVDLIMLAIPLPLVLSLHLPLKKRIGILGVFLVGSAATACGMARMALFASILGPKLFSEKTVGGVSSSDDIGIVSILMFWGMLEIGIAIVAICLPIIYRLARDASPGHFLNSLLSLRPLRGSTTSKNASFTELDSHQIQGSLPHHSRGYRDDSSADLRVPLSPGRSPGAPGWSSMWKDDSSSVPLQGPVHAVAVREESRGLDPATGQIWEMREIKQTVEVV